MAWALVALTPAPAQREERASTGVVVETVGAASALAAAGIEAGDVLWSWQQPVGTSADAQAAQGRLDSPFDWRWLTIERAPRGTVLLDGSRAGEPRGFTVEPGSWQARVRPILAPEQLEIYTRGQRQLDRGDLEAAANAWGAIPSTAAGGSPLKSWLLLRLGEGWSAAKDWQRAHGAYDQALAAAADRRAREAIWQTIADSYKKQHKWQEAERAYLAAQEIRAPRGESLAQALGLRDLGGLAWNQGQLDTAHELYSQALDIRQRLAPGSLDVASSWLNLGNVALYRGDLDRAEAYYERTLGIRQRLAPGSSAMIGSLINLGAVAQNRGELDRASDFYRRAQELLQVVAPDSPHVGTCLLNLGLVEMERGQLDLAMDSYRRALAVYRERDPGGFGVASSLNNLGILARTRGELTQAADYFQRALELKRMLAPESADIGRGLGNLGLVAMDRGHLEQSEIYHRQALASLGQHAPGSLDLAEGLRSLGEVAALRGDLTQAADHFQQALEIQSRLAPHSAIEAATWHALAAVHRRQQQPEQALQAFRNAIDSLESQIGKLGGSHHVQASFRAGYEDTYREAIELLLDLGDDATAFHFLERFRARSFLALLAERDTVFDADGPDELDRARRRLAVRYDGVQRQLADLRPEDKPRHTETLLSELRRLRQESDDIAGKIRRASTKLADLQYPQPLTAMQAQEVLDAGTVLLSYHIGVQQTHLFILRRDDGLETLTLDLDRDQLRREVEQLRRLIAQAVPGSGIGPRRAAGLETAARRLYAQLLAPAEGLLATSQRLLILPDGPLHLLPWGALMREPATVDQTPRRAMPRRGQYLVEWKPFHLALSATVYAELQRTRPPAPPAVARAPVAGTAQPVAPVSQQLLLAAFGDPLYPSRPTGVDTPDNMPLRAAVRNGFDFGPLPSTRAEVDRIAELFPAGAATYLGAEATEEHALALTRDIRYLHFATHGIVDEQLPLNSALVLTIPPPSAPGRHNGLLQAWEIFERLRIDAELVVLSTCQSALGKEVSGEGLIGLTRAFQYAGARSVVASLWGVVDETTADLMVRFYHNLQSGQPKDEALRSAQIDWIQSRERPGDAAPFYWAAFQIYGDWR